MSGLKEWLTNFKGDHQKRVLTDVAKIFVMAPRGFHAIALVVEYGCTFSDEDGKALKLLQSFLGDKAARHMFLIISHADQAKQEAKRHHISIHDCVNGWRATLPPWVENFIEQIGENNVVLFDSTLEEKQQPKAYKGQLSKFIQVLCGFRLVLVLFTLKHCMDDVNEFLFSRVNCYSLSVAKVSNKRTTTS